MARFRATIFLSAAILVAGCRDTQPVTGGTPLFTEPFLLVPPGALRAPQGIAVDATGDVWVTDTYANALRRMTPQGTDRVLLTGIDTPTRAGFHLGTNRILFVSAGTRLYSVDPSTNLLSLVADVGEDPIDTSSVYDAATGATGAREVDLNGVGDISGAPNGEIYISILANTSENFILAIRNGITRAIFFSSLSPAVVSDASPGYLSVDGFGTVFSGFVISTPTAPTAIGSFAVYPSSPTATHQFAGVVMGPGSKGSGIAPDGTLYIADRPRGRIIVLSTQSERLVTILPLPGIRDMTAPVPTDVAVGPDGTIYVAVVDAQDIANEKGAIITYRKTQ